MEWSSSVSGNLVAADDFDDDNPWTPNRSIASTSVGRPPSEHTIRDNDHPNGEADLQDNLLTNPLYQRSPELNDTAGSSKLTNQQSTNGQHLHTDATRPSLYRVTSNSLNGLLHGLDTLAFSNTVQESLSTENADPKGARRSLEELRRFTIKGKGQPVDLQTDDTVWDDNVYQSRRPSRPRGREALLHLVQKGDSLAGIALLYGCTVCWTKSCKTPCHRRLGTCFNMEAEQADRWSPLNRSNLFAQLISCGSMTLYTFAKHFIYHWTHVHNLQVARSSLCKEVEKITSKCTFVR